VAKVENKVQDIDEPTEAKEAEDAQNKQGSHK
jgi:hypothetical protein